MGDTCSSSREVKGLNEFLTSNDIVLFPIKFGVVVVYMGLGNFLLEQVLLVEEENEGCPLKSLV